MAVRATELHLGEAQHLARFLTPLLEKPLYLSEFPSISTAGLSGQSLVADIYLHNIHIFLLKLRRSN